MKRIKMTMELTGAEQALLIEHSHLIDLYLRCGRSNIIGRDEQRAACLRGLIRCLRQSKIRYTAFYFLKEIKSAEREELRQRNLGRRAANVGRDDISIVAFGDVEHSLQSDALNAAEIAEKSDMYARLNVALTTLTSRDQRILRGLYFENKTLEAVAKELGCSKQYINILKKSLLTKLKKMRFNN